MGHFLALVSDGTVGFVTVLEYQPWTKCQPVTRSVNRCLF